MNEKTKEMSLARLKAVREAYWYASDENSGEFNALHGALSSINPDCTPSIGQQKILFFMLPDTIIGHGISWGFDDTEVRESIYDFTEKNKAAIIEALR